jgi:hypothetical protein
MNMNGIMYKEENERVYKLLRRMYHVENLT